MSVKRSLQKLVDTGIKRTVLKAATNNPVNKVTFNKALKETPPDPITSGSGLVNPVVMTVTGTTTVSIPVPPGATSVDVEVVQAFTLTDANSTAINVTVSAYP